MERPMAGGPRWVRARAARGEGLPPQTLPQTTLPVSQKSKGSLKIWFSCYILTGKKQIQQSEQLRPQETESKTWENKQLIHSKGLGPNN